MWPREFRDYPIDTPLVNEPVESGHGIIGCEMHDLNGWGNSLHIPLQSKRTGLIGVLLQSIGRYVAGWKKA